MEFLEKLERTFACSLRPFVSFWAYDEGLD